MKLSADPLCEQCLAKGLTTAATIVHHIDEDELNCDEDNLLSVCMSCHEEFHPDRFKSKGGQ